MSLTISCYPPGSFPFTGHFSYSPQIVTVMEIPASEGHISLLGKEKNPTNQQPASILYIQLERKQLKIELKRQLFSYANVLFLHFKNKDLIVRRDRRWHPVETGTSRMNLVCLFRIVLSSSGVNEMYLPEE